MLEIAGGIFVGGLALYITLRWPKQAALGCGLFMISILVWVAALAVMLWLNAKHFYDNSPVPPVAMVLGVPTACVLYGWYALARGLGSMKREVEEQARWPDDMRT